MTNSEEPRRIHISEQFAKQMAELNNFAKLNAELDNHARVQPVNLTNIHEFKQHMISSHYFDPSELEYRDQSHDSIPGISRVIWSRMSEMPELSHEDLIAIHNHEHNTYPDEEHTTINESHFHHD